jgi:hypothetical protein
MTSATSIDKVLSPASKPLLAKPDDDNDDDDVYLYKLENEGVKKSIPYISI